MRQVPFLPDWRPASDALSSPPVRTEPVEPLHARSKPWIRRAQPERMPGYLRQVAHQAFCINNPFFSDSAKARLPRAWRHCDTGG